MKHDPLDGRSLSLDAVACHDVCRTPRCENEFRVEDGRHTLKGCHRHIVVHQSYAICIHPGLGLAGVAHL
jgi:hypothetical protein